MLKWAVDEDFNNKILRAVLRRRPSIDIVRVQDIPGLSGQSDAVVLEWAATESRVLFTHDVSTMTQPAYQRIMKGLAMPGLFEVSQNLPLNIAISEILLLVDYSLPGEWV